MNLCISQVTTLSSDFETDVAAYNRAGCQAAEVWLTKLETYLESHSLDECRRLLDENQMRLPVAAFQGGLLLSEGAARAVAYEHFARRLDLCRALEVETLVIVADFMAEPGRADSERMIASLGQAAEQARARDVRLALEFQGRARFCACLETAAAVVETVHHPNLGICLDVFHYYIGASKFEDLGLVSRSNLAHVQLSDLSGVPRELATDADRILPGDGEFLLAPILERIAAIGYDGWVSLEAPNPRLWVLPPHQVAEVGMAAMLRLTRDLAAAVNRDPLSRREHP